MGGFFFQFVFSHVIFTYTVYFYCVIDTDCIHLINNKKKKNYGNNINKYIIRRNKD